MTDLESALVAPRNDSSSLSRRKALAGLALLPAAATMPAAAAEPDAIFAIIENHKALLGAYNAACVDGSEQLLAFQAQTLRGVAAQLRYLSGLEDWQTVGRLTDDPENVSKFCATMATAIEAIIRKGAT
jgi:hypothetical protein